VTGDNALDGATLGQTTMAIPRISAIYHLINKTAISPHLKAKTDEFENRSKSKDLFDLIRRKSQAVLKPIVTMFLQDSMVACHLEIRLRSTILSSHTRAIYKKAL
jgi:hypothetical protein